MEFKGTKGKWERITSDWDLSQSVFLENTEQEICEVKSKPHKNLYDALLISKAPEMLEMIKLLIDRLEENDLKELSAVKRAKQLIKEATEI